MISIARTVAPVCAAIVLASCGGGGSDDALPDRSPAEVIPGAWVVVGSSTAAGLGAPRGEGWVARLAASAEPLGVQLINLAPGLQSSQALPGPRTFRPGARGLTPPSTSTSRRR